MGWLRHSSVASLSIGLGLVLFTVKSAVAEEKSVGAVEAHHLLEGAEK